MSRRAAIAVASALAALAAAALPLGLRLTAQHAAAQRSAEKDAADVALAMTEAEAYAAFAPDTAILVDLDAADTNTVWVVSACFNRGSEAYTVDWGDGTVTAHTSSYWGTKAEHTYAERGQYVVRLSDSLSQPLYHYGITISPAISRLLRWGDHVTHADYAFGWAKTVPIGLPGGEMARWPSNLTSANGTYYGCSGLTGSIPAWPTNLTSATFTYENCTSLTGSIPAWPTNLTSANYTYQYCSGLTGQIPAWPTNLTSANWTYCGCKSLTGAWTDDPDELMPTRITSHSCTVLWASDALRALFYEDWEGTRKEGE